jgi:hypothetical protein
LDFSVGLLTAFGAVCLVSFNFMLTFSFFGIYPPYIMLKKHNALPSVKAQYRSLYFTAWLNYLFLSLNNYTIAFKKSQ